MGQFDAIEWQEETMRMEALGCPIDGCEYKSSVTGEVHKHIQEEHDPIQDNAEEYNKEYEKVSMHNLRRSLSNIFRKMLARKAPLLVSLLL